MTWHDMIFKLFLGYKNIGVDIKLASKTQGGDNVQLWCYCLFMFTMYNDIPAEKYYVINISYKSGDN